jgi:peptide/nickel transport system permease protein
MELANQVKKKASQEEQLYLASQWQLMGRKFRKHKLAIIGGVVLGFLYFASIFCDFLAPYDIYQRHAEHANHPLQIIRFFDQGRFHLRPFVYGTTKELDKETFRRTYTADKSKRYPIRFFVPGPDYKLLGLFPVRIHLFGVREGHAYLFGTDSIGRDLFSRTLYAARISLTIGLIGVCISLFLGVVLGGISGYFGGKVDLVIQRIIEILLSIPRIPLWMGLSAALPVDWPIVKTYFGIVIILSTLTWTGIARIVRGRFLQLREEDFVMAAKVIGATDARIIFGHLVPAFSSYIIVRATLSIPAMILGETALSFLGLGLRAPAVSWGTLLKDAQNIRTVVLHPWLLIPGIFVIIAVLAFNFLGDGLRDAADPYK